MGMIREDTGTGMNLREAIRNSYLAKGLREDHLERLYAIADVRSFGPGEALMEQDDDNRDLYVVVQGEAQILSVTGEPIGHVKPGMPIGEISFLDSKPRSVSVVTENGCQAVVLPYEALWKLLRENQDMALIALVNISRVLCTRLRSANKNIAALMALDESDANLAPR
jgi:CRP-like cAMP-binding protein